MGSLFIFGTGILTSSLGHWDRGAQEATLWQTLCSTMIFPRQEVDCVFPAPAAPCSFRKERGDGGGLGLCPLSRVRTGDWRCPSLWVPMHSHSQQPGTPFPASSLASSCSSVKDEAQVSPPLGVSSDLQVGLASCPLSSQYTLP